MRKNRNLPSALILLFLFIYSYKANSQIKDTLQTDSSKDTSKTILADLSLEELLDVEIQMEVASKKEVGISDAPGIVSAYSDGDIEKLGYYTLSDLANITSGYSSFTIFGEKVFETRGQKAGSFNNNKHLVLIDGIPVNFIRSYKAPTEEELPVFFAKRVEFLKGPASALYGVSAFFGVVNIVSKGLSENGTVVETKGSVGTYDFNKRLMANVLHKTDAGESKISFGYYRKGDSRDFVGATQDTNWLNWDSQRSIFMNVSHKLTTTPLKGLGAGFIYTRKNGGHGEHFAGAYSHQINDLTWESIIPYLKYERNITKKISVQSYLKGNESNLRGWIIGKHPTLKDTIVPFFNFDIYVRNIECLAQVKWSLTKRIELIAGFNYDNRYQLGKFETSAFQIHADTTNFPFTPEPTTQNPTDHFHIFSEYLQFEYTAPVLSDLIVTIGFRNDVGKTRSNKFKQLSPRVAIVQKINKRLNAKFLYGKALRAPGIVEVSLNAEAMAAARSQNLSVDAVPQLSAELINSYEGGLTYNTKKLGVAFTYFYNQTTNSLNGVKHPQGPAINMFANTPGTISARGYEFDIRYMVSKKIKLMGNYAYAKAQDDTNRVVADVPVAKANAGIIFSPLSEGRLSVAVMGRYVDSYRTFITHNGYLKGNLVIDANLVGKISKNIQLEIMVRNMLDENYKLPYKNILSLPMPGRTYLFTVGFEF